MLEFLKGKIMAITTKTKMQYVTPSRSIHELNNRIAYYNHEDIHFRIFHSYEDALEFITQGEEGVTVVADFDSKEDFDRFLEDSEICSVCGKVCFPDDECYEDGETSDTCCTECCFYDESNDMYHKGTIEEAYYKVLEKLATLDEVTKTKIKNVWEDDGSYDFDSKEDRLIRNYADITSKDNNVKTEILYVGSLEEILDVLETDDEFIDADYTDFRIFLNDLVQLDADMYIFN